MRWMHHLFNIGWRCLFWKRFFPVFCLLSIAVLLLYDKQVTQEMHLCIKCSARKYHTRIDYFHRNFSKSSTFYVTDGLGNLFISHNFPSLYATMTGDICKHDYRHIASFGSYRSIFYQTHGTIGRHAISEIENIVAPVTWESCGLLYGDVSMVTTESQQTYAHLLKKYQEQIVKAITKECPPELMKLSPVDRPR